MFIILVIERVGEVTRQVSQTRLTRHSNSGTAIAISERGTSKLTFLNANPYGDVSGSDLASRPHLAVVRSSLAR